ncbi:hypothetical protein [Flagellimonas crocea]|uniref:hypothetical protein n=1 Tax=Flagellimonas crocea TaxID=3067311 RepID=UPI00296EB72D|nr:hypothetical protein [Muricauda sp. DH64]
MSYESIVYRILIASPSDVQEEREVVSRIIQDWNDLNSFNKKIVLLPVRWETHSSPAYGVRPQEAINSQLVDDCDLLIGFFWTKLGTPTGVELGGTIEEIKRVSKAGKPVMLYFSKRGKDPSQINLKQLEALNQFKDEVYSTALVENFNSIVDFRDKLSRQLEMKIRELQEKKDIGEELIKFSFIDKKSGKLLNDKLELDIERIKIDIKKETELLKKAQNKSLLRRSLHKFLDRRNNMPIVLGIKNNGKRIFGNVNIVLKMKASKADVLNLENLNSYESMSIPYYQIEYLMREENQNEIRKLFDNNYVQTSGTTWEFNIKPFTLLPDKIKVLDNLMFLFPKDSITLEFTITMFSDNILQPIESSCELKFNFKERDITQKEIEEVIEKSIEEEDDDLPF